MTWWWILILIPVLIPAGIFLTMLVISAVDGADNSYTRTTALLECYHCGQETSSSQRTCRHCGGELQ